MSILTAVVVQDEYPVAERLIDICEDYGIIVLGSALRAEKGLDVIRSTQPDMVLIGYQFQGMMDGVDVAKLIHEEAPDTRVVFVTKFTDPETFERIRKEDHPYRIVTRPFTKKDIEEALK
ncbi:response regulator [Desulfopila inferna]|uniref:response regulator n=1 Tax=Desulfopila inferna TaxID=468528 RepID=UPI0019661135|nr:response regulator [Desulfopila inferna]MBM9604354.1 response regulator [Desulfopila inferna]